MPLFDIADGTLVIHLSESSNRTVVGTYDFDGAAGGKLIIPTYSGSFPTDTTGKEIILRSDLKQLYFRSSDDSSWVAISGSTVSGSGTDELIKISSNDTTANYLFNKITSSIGLTLSEVNDGGNESLNFAVLYGSSSNTSAEGNDSRIPTQDENDALEGTNGVPSTSNKYVTNSDPRNTNSRTPTGAAGGQLSGSYPDNVEVIGLRETSGPTYLTMSNVADGEYLLRDGTQIIGGTPAGGSTSWVSSSQSGSFTIDAASGSKQAFGLNTHAFVDIANLNNDQEYSFLFYQTGSQNNAPVFGDKFIFKKRNEGQVGLGSSNPYRPHIAQFTDLSKLLITGKAYDNKLYCDWGMYYDLPDGIIFYNPIKTDFYNNVANAWIRTNSDGAYEIGDTTTTTDHYYQGVRLMWPNSGGDFTYTVFFSSSLDSIKIKFMSEKTFYGPDGNLDKSFAAVGFQFGENSGDYDSTKDVDYVEESVYSFDVAETYTGQSITGPYQWYRFQKSGSIYYFDKGGTGTTPSWTNVTSQTWSDSEHSHDYPGYVVLRMYNENESSGYYTISGANLVQS